MSKRDQIIVGKLRSMGVRQGTIATMIDISAPAFSQAIQREKDYLDDRTLVILKRALVTGGLLNQAEILNEFISSDLHADMVLEDAGKRKVKGGNGLYEATILDTRGTQFVWLIPDPTLRVLDELSSLMALLTMNPDKRLIVITRTGNAEYLYRPLFQELIKGGGDRQAFMGKRAATLLICESAIDDLCVELLFTAESSELQVYTSRGFVPLDDSAQVTLRRTLMNRVGYLLRGNPASPFDISINPVWTSACIPYLEAWKEFKGSFDEVLEIEYDSRPGDKKAIKDDFAQVLKILNKLSFHLRSVVYYESDHVNWWASLGKVGVQLTIEEAEALSDPHCGIEILNAILCIIKDVKLSKELSEQAKEALITTLQYQKLRWT
jgi:hypothetical protein